MKGDTKDLVNSLKEDMYKYSNNLEFEKAKECKDTIDRIEYIISKQKVEFSDKKDRDVFAFHTKNGYISIAILMFNNGMLSLKDTKTFSYLEDENEALINFIYDFYQKHRLPKEIILPPLNDLDLLEEILDTNIIVPSRGLKFDLLQMAGENAIKAMEDQHMIKVIKEDKFNLLKTLGDLLNIEIPKRIELIDNSHIQGDAAVGTVVVYVNGETSKNDYRKYKITNDDKKDDLSSMHEVLYRRYYRLLTEGGTISDLLIVDGGYNQLKVAKETLSSLGFSNVKIAGLVKDNNHRTRGLINENGEEILLPNDHALLFFLTRMQDEVHRFAISFHHNLRSKSISSSFLDTIEGIGPKRKELLFKTFGSLKKIKEAPLEELTQYIPLSLAKKIKEIND
jgi:excinuclease ABC subunit C